MGGARPQGPVELVSSPQTRLNTLPPPMKALVQCHLLTNYTVVCMVSMQLLSFVVPSCGSRVIWVLLMWLKGRFGGYFGFQGRICWFSCGSRPLWWFKLPVVCFGVGQGQFGCGSRVIWSDLLSNCCLLGNNCVIEMQLALNQLMIDVHHHWMDNPATLVVANS